MYPTPVGQRTRPVLAPAGHNQRHEAVTSRRGDAGCRYRYCSSLSTTMTLHNTRRETGVVSPRGIAADPREGSRNANSIIIVIIIIYKNKVDEIQLLHE